MKHKIAAFAYIWSPVVIATSTTVAVHMAIKRFDTSTATHCGVYLAENLAGLAAVPIGLMMIEPLYPFAKKAFD